jgi:hypothetical protein
MYHAMKTYSEVEVWFPAYLILALHIDAQPPAQPLNAGGKSPLSPLGRKLDGPHTQFFELWGEAKSL